MYCLCQYILDILDICNISLKLALAGEIELFHCHFLSLPRASTASRINWPQCECVGSGCCMLGAKHAGTPRDTTQRVVNVCDTTLRLFRSHYRRTLAQRMRRGSDGGTTRHRELFTSLISVKVIFFIFLALSPCSPSKLARKQNGGEAHHSRVWISCDI